MFTLLIQSATFSGRWMPTSIVFFTIRQCTFINLTCCCIISSRYRFTCPLICYSCFSLSVTHSVTVAMAIDNTDMTIILRFACICILFNSSITLHMWQRIKDHETRVAGRTADEQFFQFLGQISTISTLDTSGDRIDDEDSPNPTNNESDEDSPNSSINQ